MRDLGGNVGHIIRPDQSFTSGRSNPKYRKELTKSKMLSRKETDKSIHTAKFSKEKDDTPSVKENGSDENEMSTVNELMNLETIENLLDSH